jgi:hypothetical protein
MLARTLRTFAAVSAAAILFAAAPAAQADQKSYDAVAEKAMVLIEKLGGIVEANKADCGKLATALQKFMDTDFVTLQKLKEESKKESEADRKAVEAKYKPRAEAAMKKVFDNLQGCSNDEKVKAAMAPMMGRKEKPPEPKK